MERNILATADIVTTVTPSFVQNFQAKFGDIIKRIELIYNGFDPDDYEDLEATLKDHKFIATYSGILYPMRSPKVLLEALAELIADGAVRREDVLLRFAGRFDLPGSSAHWDLVHRLRLEDVVEVMGQLPHKEALAALKASHLLLLVGDTLPDAGYYIPGKLYEYMAIARPILALHMEGDAQQIIETYNIGQVVHPSNKEGIKEAYLRFYRAWQEGKVIPDTEVVAVDLFSRRYQAYRLAELIEDLLA
jgi:glycosyltransferase involved in cell wall biosynthesis